MTERLSVAPPRLAPSRQLPAERRLRPASLSAFPVGQARPARPADRCLWRLRAQPLTSRIVIKKLEKNSFRCVISGFGGARSVDTVSIFDRSHFDQWSVLSGRSPPILVIFAGFPVSRLVGYSTVGSICRHIFVWII